MQFVSHVLVRCVKHLSALLLSLGVELSLALALLPLPFLLAAFPVSTVGKKRLRGPESWGQGTWGGRK